MKVNILDAHDRLEEVQKQRDVIGEYCQQIIDAMPFGNYPFYIFAHKREIGVDERFSAFMQGGYSSLEEVPTHRLIWQPRLTKPKVQTNSMLFKGYPMSDEIKVIWMLPSRELWDQYKKGNLTENKTVIESIYDAENNRERLEAKEPDDLSDEAVEKIYEQIGKEDRWKKKTETYQKI